jgi:dipeptidyl aminopeptidase/acylaminoacyl peptidase
MTHSDGFDRTVSDWLHEQAGRGAPAYLDEVLVRTTRTRQRPAWSSLERWLPVQSTARFAAVPRMAWLLIVIGLIFALGATALFIGSQNRQPVPLPFGMAGNRTVMYSAAGGDIYALDTATNRSRPLVVGPTLDTNPSLSPDGTKFVFTRQDSGSAGTAVIVANADGSGARELTRSLAGLIQMVWSPDSTRLAVVGAVQGVDGLWVVGLADKPVMVLAELIGTSLGAIEDPQWRPNGHELVFLPGPMDTVAQVGLYLIQADGTGLRAIVEPTIRGPSQPAMSPDGTKVAYSPKETENAVLHVVTVDTGADVVVDFDGTPADQGPQWSPDGTRLLFDRYHSDGTYRLAVGSVNGGPVVEIGPPQPYRTGGSQARFSSDGTKVLAFYNADGSSWILDPVDGSEIKLSDQIASPLSWARTAP